MNAGRGSAAVADMAAGSTAEAQSPSVTTGEFA